MDAEALTERLARILFVADVWGRLQANAPSSAGGALAPLPSLPEVQVS